MFVNNGDNGDKDISNKDVNDDN